MSDGSGAAKERIREAAVRLFNERGFESVVLRDIAAEADVAIGTLTYHYKRKEDLLLALVEDLQDDFAAFFSPGLSGRELLESIVSSFGRAEANRERYAFYYDNIEGFVSASPELLGRLRSFQRGLFDFYLLGLRALQDEGMVSPRYDMAALKLLACQLVDVSASWGSKASPFSNPYICGLGYAEACKGIIRPYLTDGGAAALDEAAG